MSIVFGRVSKAAKLHSELRHSLRDGEPNNDAQLYKLLRKNIRLPKCLHTGHVAIQDTQWWKEPR
jgi:hypothetical protein